MVEVREVNVKILERNGTRGSKFVLELLRYQLRRKAIPAVGSFLPQASATSSSTDLLKR
jgi:hypothetical protein